MYWCETLDLPSLGVTLLPLRYIENSEISSSFTFYVKADPCCLFLLNILFRNRENGISIDCIFLLFNLKHNGK